MDKKFKDWLESESLAPTKIIGTDGEAYQVFRISYDRYYALYYCSLENEWNQSHFKVGGIYNKEDGLLYCLASKLKRLDPEAFAARAKRTLDEKGTAEVCQKIEEIVGNDLETPQGKTLKSLIPTIQIPADADQLFHDQACHVFLMNGSNASFHLANYLSYIFPLIGWNVLEYILDKDAYVEKMARNHIADNESVVAANFFAMRRIQAEYKKVLQNPPRKFVLAREIAAAVENSGAKTAYVELLKCGKTYSFKTKTETLLLNHCTIYKAWRGYVGESWKKFERRFGTSEYSPEEVVRITDGNKTIYEAKGMGLTQISAKKAKKN